MIAATSRKLLTWRPLLAAYIQNIVDKHKVQIVANLCPEVLQFTFNVAMIFVKMFACLHLLARKKYHIGFHLAFWTS